MKRIAWILIAVFCTAVVRVQPVESIRCKACASCHCKVPGSCGMPCCQSSAPAPVMFAAAQSARVTHVARRHGELPGRLTEGKFYSPFVAPPAVTVAFSAPASSDSPAGVPLFKAHCSFLI